MKMIHHGKFNAYARVLCAFLALNVLSITSFSCASGGYKTTRSFAKWLNSTPLLLRILLYLVTGPVFIITIILDDVVFNTVDFWTGTVSSKNEIIEKEGMRIEVAHSRFPLRKSVFTVTAQAGSKTVLELRETEKKTIEVYVNGVKRAEAQGIEDALANMVTYQEDGLTTASERIIDPRDFADLETIPSSQGVQKVNSRLGLQQSNVLACRR